MLTMVTALRNKGVDLVHCMVGRSRPPHSELVLNIFSSLAQFEIRIR